MKFRQNIAIPSVKIIFFLSVLWSLTLGQISNQDIGNVGATGSYTQSGTTITIEGAGSDIWGTADAFHYVYIPLTGDCDLSVEVVSLSNTNEWAKGGIMVRESLTANSKYAFSMLAYSRGVDLQYRASTGGNAANTGGDGGITAPRYVRLVRSGDLFTAYESNNGSTWNIIGSQTIVMNESVYVGLAVTSHNYGTLCSVAFDNLTMPIPLADFTADETVVELGSSVDFTNMSANASAYSWTFEGGTPASSSDFEPTVTYNTLGVYQVSLTATNALGASDTEIKTAYITVTQPEVDITDDGGTITTESGSDGDNLIDNNNYTNFQADNEACWIDYHATKFYIAESYSITSRNRNNDNRCPFTWTFEGSDDGVTWTLLDSQTNQYFNRNETRNFSFPNSSVFNYYRLDITESRGGSDVAFAELQIFGYEVLTEADFSADNTTIYRTQSVNFTNESVAALNYNWTFSGGTPGSSTDENPTVTYNSAGTYDVTLVAVDGSGYSDIETKTGYITVQPWPAPTADFSASPTTIDNGESVSFTNTSTNAISYAWSFEGGTPATSTDENPTVSYSAPGTYSVTLIAENADGLTDTETKTDYITVNSAPIDITSDGGTLDEPSGGGNLIDDSYSTDYSTYGDNVDFEYTGIYNYIVEEYTVTSGRIGSSGWTRYYAPHSWVLYGSNDGSTWTTLDTRTNVNFSSANQTMSFTFSNTTEYQVYRIEFTSDATGWFEYTSIGEIEIFGIPQPTAEFTASGTVAYPDYAISFINQSGLATSYSWSFPGGTPSTSTAENPVVTYSSVGTYNVSLTVDDGSGNTDTEIKTDYITIVSPPTRVPGAGHTYNFVGTSIGNQGHFIAPHHSSLSLPDEGTMEVWVSLNNYTQAGGIIHKGADLNDQEYSLQLKLEEIPKITVDLGSGGDGYGREVLVTNSQLQLNTYYHVAVTWDNNTNECRLYINGRLDDISTGVPFDTAEDDGPLLLGIQIQGTYSQDPSLGHVSFDGIMDEVRIWDKELTQVRIRDWMCKKVTPAHPNWSNLQAYYRFEEILDGSDITIDDISLNDNVAVAGETTGLQYIWSPFPVGDDAVYTVDPLSSLYYTTAESDSLVLDYIVGDFHYAAIVYNDMSPNYTNIGGDIDDIFTGHYWDVWSDENLATFDFYYYYNDFQSSYTTENFRLLSRNEPAENQWVDSYTTNNVANGEFEIEDMFLRQQFILGGSDAEPFTGDNYYVRPDGSDSNDGTTPATAWATITHAALQALGPRDTIFIAAGTYNSFAVSHSGNATFPVVYYGDTTGVYFDGYAGAGEINVGTGSNYSGQVSNQSNITFLNMDFQNATSAGLYLNTATNIRVEYCDFASNGSYSINANGVTGYMKINNNNITSGSAAGIRMANSSGAIEVTNNEIIKTSGSNLGNGIEVENTSFNLIGKNAIVEADDAVSITNCPVAGNVYENRIVNPTDNGIYIDDAENGAIRNNLIYGDGGEYADGIYMIDCDFNVVNNTIDDVGGYGIYGNNCDDGIWKNNIITNNNYGIYYTNGTPSRSYNCSWNNNTNFLNQGTGSFSSNPRYVDPDGADNATGATAWRDDDFHIQSIYGSYHGGTWTTDTYFSDCIDAGDPSDSYLDEPNDNGDRVNCGRYGGTDQASLSGGFQEIFEAPQKKWIMLGVPLEPDDGRPISVYGDDFGGQMPLTINGTDTTWNGWMCIRWEVDDSTSEYFEYGDETPLQPPDCEPGISHFIYQDLSEILEIDIDGSPVAADVYQDVYQKPETSWGPTAYGLNMFANPFRETFDMGSLKVIKSGTEYTIPQAADNGWISPYIYTWSYVSQNYDIHIINDLNEIYPIPKWQGFWFAQIDTDSELQLKMPFDGRIEMGKALAKKQATDATDELASFGAKHYLKESSYDKNWDWFLKFGVVNRDYSFQDLENYIGVYEKAVNGTDPWDGMEVSSVAQLLEEYVQLSMVHDDGAELAADIQASGMESNQWEIELSKAGDEEDFFLVWPHIRQVPQNIRLSLLSASRDTLVSDLRQSEGYNFQLDENKRNFFIVSRTIADNTPPQFTFTISQNHYLPEIVSMYIVPSEPLEQFVVLIDGEAAEYTVLNSPPNLYKLNFTMKDNQLPNIQILGMDQKGNTGEMSIQGGTNISYAKVSTNTDQQIETREFTVHFSKGVFPRQTPVIVSNLPLEINYPADFVRLSEPISITPGNLEFENRTYLRYNKKIEYQDAELYQYLNNRWVFITAYSTEMEIPGTGIYALFSRSGQRSDETEIFAKDFYLDYPSPNPFNNSTLLRYQVHNGGNIKLEIYNLLGEKVTTLYDKYLLQGSYEIFWNGKDNRGNYLPSGIYFVQMKSKTQQDVKKITLLK